jgi:hypothetical protein
VPYVRGVWSVISSTYVCPSFVKASKKRSSGDVDVPVTCRAAYWESARWF